MDFSKFYWMTDAQAPGALHVHPTDSLDETAILKRMNRVNEPLVFRQSAGQTPEDFIGTGFPALFLISDKVKRVLSGAGFTGWDTYPVVVYGADDRQLEGYHGFSVTGRCGRVDSSLSPVVWRDPPVPQGRGYEVWVGLYFQPESWSGEDIFCPDGNNRVLVSEGVKTALDRANVSNVRFQRLTEIERRRF